MKKFFTGVSLLFCLLSGAQTFTWNGHSVVRPDVNDTIVIPVSALPDTITHNFGITSVCFDIYHPSKTSLLIMLVAPDGHSVLLMEGHGTVGENFIGTCMGMDGVPFELGSAPYTGTFLPFGDLSSLNNNQNPNGNWLLIVNNHHNDDTGSVRSVSLQFTNDPPRGNGLGGSNAGPSGPFVWPGLVCPGGASSCDLLPDMTASAQHILSGYREYPGRIEVSNSTPNIGYGPIEIYGLDSCFCNGQPSPCNVACPGTDELQHILRQRIYRKKPNTDTLEFYDRNAGFMTFHPSHGHLHVDGWGSFTLRSATSDPDPRNWPIIGTSVKQSYCLTNLGTCAGSPGECVDANGNVVLTTPNYGFGFQTGCDLTQGIYSGYLDVYGRSLNEPIMVDNICNGTYYLVSITDPDNRFLESNENNNWVAVPITLSMQSSTPLITSGSQFLCAGGSVVLTASIAPSYQWSTGDTSRSITVTSPGTYYVTTPCGASAPFEVTSLPQGSSPSVSIAVTGGALPACANAPVEFTATPTFGGSTPSYQWKVNGVNVGTNSPRYVHSAVTSGQKISCVLTSGINCFSSSPVSSDSITFSVHPVNDFSALVTQTRGYNPFCAGDTLVFNAMASPGENPTYQWKVDGINAGDNTNEFKSTTLMHGQVITCAINALPSCGLDANIGVAGNFNTIQTTTGAAYPTWYGNGRQQYLVRASELQQVGLTAGFLNRLMFITGPNVGNPATLNEYTIKLALVSENVLTSTMLTPAFSTVFGPLNYTPVINATNYHNFSSPFYWDGTSNILVEICFSNDVYGNGSYQTRTTFASFDCSAKYQADHNVVAPCDSSRGTVSKTRPYMVFSRIAAKEVTSSPVTAQLIEPVYHFIGNGNWNIQANWLNGKMPPTHVLHCAEIIIDPINNGECVLNTEQVVSPGARITVVAGKKFRVIGNVLIRQ